MKPRMLKRTLTAALLTLAATAAYGQQQYAMTANIPFSFRAVGSDLPAGRYKVDRTPGNAGTMELRNIDTGKTVFIPAKGAPIAEAKNARPRLIFQCGGDEGCSLERLWSGTGSGLEFPTPALTAAQKERLETIYLDRFKSK
jgi:hypothetical protein